MEIKKSLSLILASAMLLGTVPAFAEGEEETAVEPVTVGIKITDTNVDGEVVELPALYPNLNPTKITGTVSVDNVTGERISVTPVLTEYKDGLLTDVKVGDELNVPAGDEASQTVVLNKEDGMGKDMAYKFYAFNSNKAEVLCEPALVAQPDEMLETMAKTSRKEEDTWNLRRLAEVMKKAETETVVIGALGGSITEGAGASDPGKFNRYSHRVADWFEEKYPGHVERAMAGVGGTDSYLGVHRMNQHLMEHKPDLVMIDFAVNDNAHLRQNFAYERILRTILNAENSPAAIMTFFLSSITGSLTNDQHLRTELGSHYGVPMISVRDAVREQNEAGNIEVTDALRSDKVHPTDYCHYIASECIISVLDDVYENLDEILASEEYTVPSEIFYGEEKYANGKIFVGSSTTHERQGEYVDDNGLGIIIKPASNDGWKGGYGIDWVPAWSTVFGDGWSTDKLGSKISFEVEGKYVSLLYRIYGKDNTAGVIKVTIDNGEPYYFDSKDGAYGVTLTTTADKLPELKPGKHIVTIETVTPKEAGIDDEGREGSFFGLCGLMVSE